ncbi:MAG: protein kinase [Thermoanaerobaculia bacterium]|nr:protein kinase [Thermoanaerobaculia bacterium]
MTLAAGTKLGPYEILSPIGAGGMGEVYRAKDPRLDREVAIKVLPEDFLEGEERKQRFEREARLLAALNHPGIAAIYSFEEIPSSSSSSSSSLIPVLVMELLEGETLRSALAGAKLSTRKALDFARQIAQGLAAAHEKGIVHRDLKPENVFVTKDGRVKILDFGLAKLAQPEGPGSLTNIPTAAQGTQPGMVMGTLGYMSPEQVKGLPTDSRSDIFSFGAVLYEMLTGDRAFKGDSAAETISAILREDPPDISATNQNVPAGLERIVSHCLEKNPEQRFHSAHDLAFDLESLSGSSAVGATSSFVAARREKSRGGPILLGALVLAAGAALGFFARNFRGSPAPPSFQRLTFRRGTVWAARFAPDGQTVVYGAAWENNPIEVFLTRPESPESRPLGLKSASLFGVSPTGELAVMLDAKTTAIGYDRSGTLARVPLAGGSPRPILENVRYADWGPDGRELMVERVVAGRHRIEFPIGKTIYESAVRLETPRVSPQGDAVAFFERAEAGNVSIRVVDLAGKARTLVTVKDWWNLAWSPDGREVVYAAPEEGASPNTASLLAVSRTGKRRLILRFPGTLELHDVARDGRVLFGRVGLRNQVVASSAGEKNERELSWLDGASPVDLSPDGKTVLINEGGEGGGPNSSIYVRGTRGSPATLIGEGRGQALSPDGRHVLAVAPTMPSALTLLPTGIGTPRKLEFEGISSGARGSFFPDGKHLLLVDTSPGQLPRTFVFPIEGGKPRPLGPAGLVPPGFGNPISHDGRFVVLIDNDRRSVLCPTGGGPPSPLAGMEAGEFPIQWSPDGRFLYIHRGGGFPAKIWKFELATRRRELFRELAPADVAGVTSIEQIFLTPDGRTLVYGYYHNLSDLYTVSGLK